MKKFTLPLVIFTAVTGIGISIFAESSVANSSGFVLKSQAIEPVADTSEPMVIAEAVIYETIAFHKKSGKEICVYNGPDRRKAQRKSNEWNARHGWTAWVVTL